MRNRERYREKRELLLEALAKAGLRVAGSQAGIYLWVEVPAGETSEGFATRVLERGVRRLPRLVLRAVAARATSASR